MAEITIHGIPGSPFVRSALLGLEEKGVSYRLAAMAMGEHKSEAHLQRNPFGRIPVLDHGAFRLYETQAILRYVDAAFPGPALQPKEVPAAARMNQIAGIVDWYFFPQVSATITWQRIIVPQFRGGTPDEAVIAAALPNARICVDELERLKGDNAFMAGGQISIADLMLAPHLAYFARTPEGAGMLKGKTLAAWLARMNERASMQATEREKLLSAA
ncbi:MAG: glutathione S-transferase family protein [Proteobacteria bacterium]|nr:glutathione S-transferase family protein [Pseudomonadota bacterium]MBI3499540.1 glutathione S-transferase family protein [Pseudomonadota bacterium]